MSRGENRKIVLEFLDTICADDIANLAADEDLRFEESGLIDSLSMLEIVSFLEKEFSVDFSQIGIDADDLGSIKNILDLIDRSAG